MGAHAICQVTATAASSLTSNTITGISTLEEAVGGGASTDSFSVDW